MARGKIPLTLIHNKTAGDGSHDREQLTAVLAGAGYEVRYVRYKRDDLAAALEHPADLIVIAGGDGTIAKVAALARPDGPPLAILPLGTANNIAKSLGIDKPVEDLVAAWRSAGIRSFYPIDSDGPWGQRRLIEGIGFGAIEEAIAHLPDKTDRRSACRGYAKAVMTDAPECLELTLDQETISGQFAVVEISTIPFVGPNLRLAAIADADRREFAVSFLRAGRDERRALRDWLLAPATGNPPPLTLRRTESAVICGHFQRVRIDGGVKCAADEKHWDRSQPIVLSAARQPLRFLVPG